MFSVDRILSQPEGPPFQLVTRQASFLTETVNPQVLTEYQWWILFICTTGTLNQTCYVISKNDVYFCFISIFMFLSALLESNLLSILTCTET